LAKIEEKFEIFLKISSKNLIDSYSLKNTEVNQMSGTIRLHCEFSTCSCPGYVGTSKDSICEICMHGSCWHKNGGNQFTSPRLKVRTGIYQIEFFKMKIIIKNEKLIEPPVVAIQQYFLPIQPFVPPLPVSPSLYCECSAKLPV
jgi:hypothetical protein